MLPEIVISRVDGGYQVVFKDHDTCQKKTTLALQLMDVPRAIEDVLNSATVPWVRFKSYTNPKGLDRFKE